jgi:hypothetical protein
VDKDNEAMNDELQIKSTRLVRTMLERPEIVADLLKFDPSIELVSASGGGSHH